MTDKFTINQSQIAFAVVQHLGRLGKIPSGWETETKFTKADGLISATVTIRPPEAAEKEGNAEAKS